MYYDRAVQGLREVYGAFHWNRDPANFGAGHFADEYAKPPVEMEDRFNLILGEDALEQIAVEDGAHELVLDLRCELLWLGAQVNGDDGAAALGVKPLDQPVADLTRGSGHENDWLAHRHLLYGHSGGRPRWCQDGCPALHREPRSRRAIAAVPRRAFRLE
jgi:hypothetical protein